jgi:flagellar basal-body rod modification protein FlgD
MSITNEIINMQNNTNRVNYDRARANLGSDRLDKQAFLQLLMAKLQHQNPLDPVKDADFLNQQAALAQVEKLDDLAKAMQSNGILGQASSMVGKTVDVRDSFGNTITGEVESASFANGTAALSIDGGMYSLDQVAKIYR